MAQPPIKMKPLRIALWNNLPSGGGKRALYEIVAGLSRRGHYLESWCPPTAHRNYLPLDTLMQEHVVPYDNSRFKPGHVWERFGVAYRQFRKQYAAMEEHSRVCAEAIHAGSFDVLLAANCWDFAVSPIGKFVHLPKVIYHQEPRRDLYEARPRLPWVARPAADNRFWPPAKLRDLVSDQLLIARQRVEMREELDSITAFDLVLCNSAFSRETLLRCYGLDSRVCYLGINPELFKPSDSARERHVIGLGGFEPHKGIDTAIAALGTIAAGERPKLLWIGNLSNQAYRSEMIAMAARLEVEFENRQLVSDAALVDALSRSAVMIYTSRLEPFGLAPLEANACGTPVVAVAEGGVRETIQHEVNGLLVPDRNAAALGAAVLRLLRDPALARQLGETGRKQVETKWSWEFTVNRLEAALYETCSNRATTIP